MMEISKIMRDHTLLDEHVSAHKKVLLSFRRTYQALLDAFGLCSVMCLKDFPFAVGKGEQGSDESIGGGRAGDGDPETELSGW